MDLEEYTQLLESPTSVDASQAGALRDLLQYAPYCASARLLLLKAQYDEHQDGKPVSAHDFDRAMLAVPPQTLLYLYLHPRKINRSQRAYKRFGEGSTQSYFDMIEKMQEVADQNGLTFDEIRKRYMLIREYNA